MKPLNRLSTLLFAALLLGTAQAQSDNTSAMQDEHEIIVAVDTLFVQTDAKNWDAVRSLFINEIAVDFSSLGGAAQTMPADDLVAGWNQGLHAQKESHHMTSNPLVSIAGNAAEVVTQGYAYNRLTDSAEEDGFWEVWGTYTVPFVRTEAGWKMSGITFDAKHSRGDMSVPGHTLE